jgi:uncharacterized membrane protein
MVGTILTLSVPLLLVRTEESVRLSLYRFIFCFLIGGWVSLFLSRQIDDLVYEARGENIYTHPIREFLAHALSFQGVVLSGAFLVGGLISYFCVKKYVASKAFGSMPVEMRANVFGLALSLLLAGIAVLDTALRFVAWTNGRTLRLNYPF